MPIFTDGRLRGYHVLQYLQMLSPKTTAIMLIPDSERDLVVDAFRGGARGVFCRLQSIKLLSKCIRTVHDGQIWADTRNLAFILEFLTQLKPLRLIKPGGGMTRLTPREAGSGPPAGRWVKHTGDQPKARSQRAHDSKLSECDL